MKKKLIIILGVLIIILGVTYYLKGMKINTIVSSPGHLTNLKKIDNLNEEVVTNLNTFAFDLYDQLYEESNNLFISPVSIYLALGMTYNGADGITKEEMAKVLKADKLSLSDFNKLNRDLQYLILGYKKSTFELANSIWIRDTFEEDVKKDFIKYNKEYYGAMIASLDFNHQEAVDDINNWVKKNTKKRITKVIEEPIDPLTVMFLINTIYFKADWKNPFDVNETIGSNFYINGNIIKVEMMHKHDLLEYVENDLLQAVLLPYKDNKTSMFILLPKDNIKNLKLNNDVLSELISEMKQNKVDLHLGLPKVKLEYEKKLKKPLMDLGMTSAFLDNANFSEMADRAVERGLHIDDVTHKSFLAIDEKGTEAAAVTSVEMKLEAFQKSDYEMIVNKPFVIGIIDNESEAILFLGNIFKPTLK